MLILSRFAGASYNADDAIIVNPFDIQSVADALAVALDMSREERVERWTSLFAQVARNDVRAWSRGFISRLEAVRGEPD